MWPAVRLPVLTSTVAPAADLRCTVGRPPRPAVTSMPLVPKGGANACSGSNVRQTLSQCKRQRQSMCTAGCTWATELQFAAGRKLDGLAWQASRVHSLTKLGVELLDIHSRSGSRLRLHAHNTAGSRTPLHRGRPQSGGGTTAGRSGGRFGGGRLAAASAARARAMACRRQIAAGSTPSPAGGGVGAGAHGPAHGAHGLHGAGSAAGSGASATTCRSGRFQLGQGTQSHVLCPRCGGGGRRRRMSAVGEWLGPPGNHIDGSCLSKAL